VVFSGLQARFFFLKPNVCASVGTISARRP
jgi:hypothetical protein